MEPYRLNSPDTSAIMLEVLGHQLQFSQDPNSKHLGTTVWDASMVFAKYLEKNCRKGRFCASKLKGKRVIELGAGCGVAGFAMALLGCDVVSTDQTEVLPLLIRNAERNTSRIMQKDPGLVDSFGSINVAELNWGNEDHIRAVDPPFDYIIGTDVVYAEHLLEPLLRTIIALSGPKTTFLLGYEIRSTNVHEQMLELWKRNFEVKVVPRRKMDIKYQHSSIQLYIMTLKPSQVRTSAPIECSDEKTEETETQCSDEEKTEETDEVDMVGVGDSSRGDNKAIDSKDEKANADADPVISVPDKMLTEWEARRYGAMAARLLRDVQIQ